MIGSRALAVLGVTMSAMGSLTGCQWSPSRLPLQLETSPAGTDTRLTLMTAPGLQVNARLKPALELPDGRVLRFDSPHLTADSAYFAAPPSALLQGRDTRIHGKLRASICDLGKTVCRSIVIQI